MSTPRAGYFLKDGTKVPGTTTIIGRWKESGGLLQWAFQQGKSGAATLYEERDKAADIGTLAHAYCDGWMRDPASMDDVATLATAARLSGNPDPLRALQAFSMFKAWVTGQQATAIPCEEPMISEAHRYGGTPDFMLRIDGTLAMADLKTSSGIYRDYALQLAAYSILWDENHPHDPITGGYHILRLGKDSPDFEHRYFAELEDAKKCFLLLREAYDLDLALKKRIK